MDIVGASPLHRFGMTAMNAARSGFDCSWREMMESMAIAACMFDTRGHIIWYNAAAAQLWGRHPDPERELQILRMLVKGKGLNGIASDLAISNKSAPGAELLNVCTVRWSEKNAWPRLQY